MPSRGDLIETVQRAVCMPCEMGDGNASAMPLIMTGLGRDRHLADPAVSSILTAGLPSWGMTVPVTDLSLTGRHLTGRSGSTTVYCAAQSNDSFLGSRRSCQVRRAAQSAITCCSPSTDPETGSNMRFADVVATGLFASVRPPVGAESMSLRSCNKRSMRTECDSARLSLMCSSRRNIF